MIPADASTIELRALLADPVQAGSYFADLRDREALIEAGNALHFVVAPVSMKGADSADMLLGALAEALKFPDWFGGNWDALADCLSDLSWWGSEGYVLVIEHVEDLRAADPEGFATALEIFDEAAVRWVEERVPFWAFLLLPSAQLDAVEG
jgi:RNAse (barnase) inhibitor barstar